jgi:hypothetical protein
MMNKNNKCRSLKQWLLEIIGNRFSIDADWIQDHIANCPKCRRRVLHLGKVEVALSLLKTQPHQLDLLSRANTQALGILKHSLRNAPKAGKLKTMQPEPGFAERYGKYVRPSANAAACLAILILAKIGVFESMQRFDKEGQKVVRQYYATHLDKETTDEIFTS